MANPFFTLDKYINFYNPYELFSIFFTFMKTPFLMKIWTITVQLLVQ